MKVDAENRIVGRLGSTVARKVKEGEEIDIVNAEKAVISGDRQDVIEDYRQKYERGSRDFGPYYPKRPDKILKRIITRMLPDSKEEDLDSKVKTYLADPMNGEAEELGVKKGEELRNRNYVKLEDISKSLGWKPRIEVE